MRKKLLVSMTAIILLVGLAFAAIPFASSLRPSARALNDDTTIVYINKIQAGVLQQFLVEGRPLFIFRPDARQWANIHAMDRYVWDTEIQAWSPDVDAFVYWGDGTHWGHALDLKPANSSNLLDAYNQSPSDYYRPVWLGGYWSDSDPASYDLAGRSIKDWAHSYAGDTYRMPNLRAVHVSIMAPGKLAIYRNF